MNTIGVIGAGQMGAGIAQVAAAAGYRVLLSDREVALAERGAEGIAKSLARQIEKGKLSEADSDATLARIEPVGDVARFGDCDLVIEAATRGDQARDLCRHWPRAP